MDAANEVKSRLNIEDVVGEYVQLKRTGRNFKGLSPWTNERTPSFVVSPEKNIWHDFSSAKGGDMISFVMEMEGLDFRGALQLLARKAGVDIESFDTQKSQSTSRTKTHIVRALDLSARFYQTQLTASKPALKYLLESRKFSKQTIIDWRLGYSPNVSSAVTGFLGKNGFDAHEIKLTGLGTDRHGKLSDMFRGRIMIPLCDSRGQVIGFTARLLKDQADSPKYINTPQTLVYDKSRHVFGLHFAKESIRKTGYVVVVEGNMDVIASHQAGVVNVVATAGTAITEQHLRELKRFTGDVRLCFDADRAGLDATVRAIPLAQKIGLDLSIISIEGAKDTDELIKERGVKAWQEAIDSRKYAADWVIEYYQKVFDITSAQGKRQFSDAVLAVIRRIADEFEQEHYLKKIADLTDVSLVAVREKFDKSTTGVSHPRKKIRELPKFNKTDAEYQKLQDHFLGMVLFSVKNRKSISGLNSDFFSENGSREVFEFVQNNPDYKGGKALPKELLACSDYVKIISLQFEELYQSLPQDDLAEQAAGLRRRLISEYIKLEKTRLAEQMRLTTDEAELRKLMQQADKLNQLIKEGN